MFGGGLVAGLVVTLGAGALSRATGGREDATLTALYLLALALGVAMVSARGGSAELTHLLFGSVLGVDDPALLLMAGVSSLTLLVMAPAWRPLVLDCSTRNSLQPTARGEEHGTCCSWRLSCSTARRLSSPGHADGSGADDVARGGGQALGARDRRHRARCGGFGGAVQRVRLLASFTPMFLQAPPLFWRPARSGRCR